jgi:ribosomal protein S18 acetylase RimI-like enzyme
MGSSISKAPELSVVSFRRLEPGALDGLLEEQRDEWLRRLSWDLGEVTRFLADAIRDRSLKGSAVLINGEPVGFGFYTVEVDRCLIGDLYVRSSSRRADVNAALVAGLVEQVLGSRTRKRIESHSICFDTTGFDAAFADEGFEGATRAYMELQLTPESTPAADHARVEIRPWRDNDFAQAVEVIYQAYRGTIDARMNCQYRTREGCADLLDALTDSAWCGTFSRDATSVAVDRKTNRICGVAICSRISIAAAHLGQVSVLPTYQGQRIGRALIGRTLGAARGGGCQLVTLAVTKENAVAARLYDAMGFDRKLEFRIYTREADRGGQPPRRPAGLR